MEYSLILTLLTFLLPSASNLICCTVTGLDLLITPVQRERRLKLWLFAFYFTDFFVWINLLFQAFFPGIFAYTQQLWYLALLIDPVLLYLAVRILTPDIKGRVAVKYHFIAPIALVFLSTVWRLAITQDPSGASLAIGYGDNIIHFNTQIFFEVVFSITYMILCITSIVITRRHLIRDANPAMVRSLNWMKVLLPFSIVVLLLPSEIVYFAGETLTRTTILFIWVLLLVTIHVVACIKIMRRKYHVPMPAPGPAPLDLTPTPSFTNEAGIEPVEQNTNNRYERFKGELSIQSFDKWFAKNKPYLDPNVKIDDLLPVLGVNRVQFSSFVNKSYGMSFVNYVGKWRLKELERLKKLPVNRNSNLNALLPQSGFGSYKSYKRSMNYHYPDKE